MKKNQLLAGVGASGQIIFMRRPCAIVKLEIFGHSRCTPEDIPLNI